MTAMPFFCIRISGNPANPRMADSASVEIGGSGRYFCFGTRPIR